MKRLIPVLGILAVLGGAIFVSAEEPTTAPTEKPAEIPVTKSPLEGATAFQTVYEVLMSPRCMNCHPNGDKPLQYDNSQPHAMNISRQSEANGLKCATCHQEKNSEAIGVAGGPPGAPNWHLPSKEMPLIFQGRTAPQLCAQLKDPTQNGDKNLAQLLEHVGHDALVLWGWNPGGNRTKPPHSHKDFVAAFQVWAQSGGACPTK